MKRLSGEKSRSKASKLNGRDNESIRLSISGALSLVCALQSAAQRNHSAASISYLLPFTLQLAHSQHTDRFNSFFFRRLTLLADQDKDDKY